MMALPTKSGSRLLSAALRPVTLLVAAILGGSLVVACGDTSPDASASLEDGSLAGTPVDLNQWFDTYAEAYGDITTVRAVVDQEMSASGQSKSQSMVVEIDASDPAEIRYRAKMVDASGYVMTMVCVEELCYVDVGGGFAEHSLDDLGMSIDDLNPTASIENQKDAVVAVALVGPERVEGVDTNHYVITYDVGKMNKALADQGADGTIASHTAKADIWLDAGMLPVKHDYTLAVQVEGMATEVRTISVYSNFGDPLRIEAP